MSSADPGIVSAQLYEHLGQISGILFFLLGAMTIVELIDAHDGFDVITSKIKTKDKRKLLWVVSIVTFFLSAVLDNLTTTIVMVSLLRKLIKDKETRMFFVGMVVIAANAGGAWTPIGDVTTTMLWIGGQITTVNIMIKLILPSLVCLIVPMIFLSFRIKGKIEAPEVIENMERDKTSNFEQKLILGLGIGALIFVPVFKTITHLPPFLGMLFGLGILWVVTEIIHKNKNDADKDVYSVVHALRKADVPSVLFFLGILIAISALESTHQLADLAAYMDKTIGNLDIIVISIGLLSAIVDNVPLVAATMGMYDLKTFPTDHYFWEFIAYCAGTGGSCLIIGSAAGVAAMGMEKIDFLWYMKKISLLALLGYFAGAFFYMAQHYLFG
jgi:Na+/H+ antiporter NhaD/arsenite permease-like protein